VSLDLGFDDAQRAIGTAVEAFCNAHCDDEVVKSLDGKFPEDLWRELAELGVLALVTPEGDGGAVELVAALEPLGCAVFPGPLAATFLATQVLPEAERARVAAGAAVVAVGSPPLLPFAPVAQLFVEIEGDIAYLAEPAGEVASVETLGGEPWGRTRLTRTRELGSAVRALALHDIALAAYLAAAGDRLVRATAEHARARHQFGRAIGEFQAVAHPLADCHMQLTAAAGLARTAACRFQDDAQDAPAAAAAARLSAARAALAAAHTSHQLFGAVGITLEGEVFHVSRRIRQLASGAPGEARARELLLADTGL
jgi:alkylation response protein AidB-like acyl-CoA dehydrogenase